MFTSELEGEKNENRSTFGKVMGKSGCPVFFLLTGYVTVQGKVRLVEVVAYQSRLSYDNVQWRGKAGASKLYL